MHDPQLIVPPQPSETVPHRPLQNGVGFAQVQYPPEHVSYDGHEPQLPPQPFWLFELAHVLSHDSELPQLGPEQLQFGEVWQLALLSLQPSPQLTLVDRGGSPLLVPASTPGPG